MFTAKQLERAEQEADAIWRQTYQPDSPPETDKATPEASGEETPEEAVAPADEETREAEAAEEKPVEKPPVVDTTDWKAKYQTIDGKYKVEIPRLTAEIGQWRDYAASLSKRITELEETLKAAPKKIDEPETDEDLAELEETSPDFARIIKKLKDEHRQEIAALRKELETGVTADLKSVKEEVNLNKQERFDLAMARAGVPDWRTVDHDPEFIAWLSTPVPYTRATKLDLLRHAAQNLDAETAARFFLDFKAEQTTETSTQDGETPPQDLTKFVAPPRSGGSSIPKKSGQPPWLTRAQYEKFMNPRSRFNPSDYGGKTEKQVGDAFDAAILKGTLI
jgi:septum formation inhibitor MinC